MTKGWSIFKVETVFEVKILLNSLKGLTCLFIFSWIGVKKLNELMYPTDWVFGLCSGTYSISSKCSPLPLSCLWLALFISEDQARQWFLCREKTELHCLNQMRGHSMGTVTTHSVYRHVTSIHLCTSVSVFKSWVTSSDFVCLRTRVSLIGWFNFIESHGKHFVLSNELWLCWGVWLDC